MESEEDPDMNTVACPGCMSVPGRYAVAIALMHLYIQHVVPYTVLQTPQGIIFH